MYIWGMETMMEKNFQEWRMQKQYRTRQKKTTTLREWIKDVLSRHAFISSSEK